MGQFLWFPDGETLLRLLLPDGDPPQDAKEHWAMDLYRATFSPGAVPRWCKRGMVWSSALAWLLLLLLAVFLSLSDVGLCPAGCHDGIWWDALAWAALQLTLSLLLLVEMAILWRGKTPLNPSVRKSAWLAAHPRPAGMLPSAAPSLSGCPPARPLQGATLPWWFWVGRGGVETILRMLVFVGGFLVSIAVVLYVSYATGARLSAQGFWQTLGVWCLLVLVSIAPITLWLYHLDWEHRDRSILLLWAAKQG